MKRIFASILALLCLLFCFASCESSSIEPNEVQGNRMPLYAGSLVAYHTFVNNCRPLPKWFISYETVSFLGEFVSFEFEKKKDIPDIGIKQYDNGVTAAYCFKDDSGSEFEFLYYHWYLVDEPKEAYDGIRSNVSENGAKSITWLYKGTEFVFFGLEDYPENATGTFVSRLLNPETVDAAVAEFNLAVKGY